MFKEELILTVNSYCSEIPDLSAVGRSPSEMLIDFVIEKFKQIRNYPTSYTEEKIEADLYNHKSLIAMAVIDLFSKEGAENQTSNAEGGVTRKYENAFISDSLFKGVSPFVHIL